MVAGGLGWFLISLAFLIQAMAVRRHGGPVMVVVTVMAVALHLLNKVSGERFRCQQQVLPKHSGSAFLWADSPLKAASACLSGLDCIFIAEQFNDLLIKASAKIKSLGSTGHVAYLQVDS